MKRTLRTISDEFGPFTVVDSSPESVTNMPSRAAHAIAIGMPVHGSRRRFPFWAKAIIAFVAGPVVVVGIFALMAVLFGGSR